MLSSALLKTEGFATTIAKEGERAVMMARDHKPELVLLDVTLPGIDGIEGCRKIRELSDCYIVMVTSREDELDRAQEPGGSTREPTQQPRTFRPLLRPKR